MTALASTRRALPFVLAAAISSLCACSRSADSAVDAKVRITERLRGEWVLAEWVPAQALDPVLGTLLAAQIGHLVITIDDQSLDARGIGIAAQRSYRITGTEENQFSAVLVEGGTIEYAVTGSFQGNELHFASQTSPWVGRGRLVRAH